MEYIAFDAHKHYTLASVARPDGRLVREQRLPHDRGALQQFLARCEPGSPVAVETLGHAHSSPAINERSGPGSVPALIRPASTSFSMSITATSFAPRTAMNAVLPSLLNPMLEPPWPIVRRFTSLKVRASKIWAKVSWPLVTTA